MIRKKRSGQLWTPTVATTGWAESTLAEQAWVEARGATVRWAVAGAIVGILVGIVAFAPASWLASAIASATNQRLVLADARGTIWSGSAVAVLAGGPDSRDATYLPGRLEWTLAPRWYGVDLAARHDCCLNGTTTVQIRPGLGRIRATLVPRTDWVGQWPSAWLGGLGTPWNTLQLGGSFRLLSPGVTIESVEGRWRLDGRVELVLEQVSSRLTTLETLGTYRVALTGSSNGPTLLTVATQEGALQLTGNGTWGPGGVKFRGEARAEAGDEPALANLLNIIGRRDGARSIISIG
ncbi:MAG TPA: type II secretion system protein N [Caldimonas sp.]|nr:type II secretion system protein N [Caldimonas sp.]HEX4233338.1 type II secretion system protein N [Caldimonas sp.]